MCNIFISIGRSRGACPVHTPPMGPNSFVFAYIFTEKCPRQRSMLPQWVHAPPMGNPGSATDIIKKFIYLNVAFIIILSISCSKITFLIQ